MIDRWALSDAVFAARQSAEGFAQLIRIYDIAREELPRSELFAAEHEIVLSALRTGNELDRAEVLAREHVALRRTKRRLVLLAKVLAARGNANEADSLSREADALRDDDALLLEHALRAKPEPTN